MRTSLIEIEQIEQYLTGCPAPPDALLFEAQQIIQPALRDKVALQRQTYRLINQYGRKQLRSEIEAVHQQLFNREQHRNFKQKILRLFSNR